MEVVGGQKVEGRLGSDGNAGREGWCRQAAGGWVGDLAGCQRMPVKVTKGVLVNGEDEGEYLGRLATGGKQEPALSTE